MSMHEITEKLAVLKKQAQNRSTKPLQRLKATIAGFEYQRLRKSLPGSVKRGLDRGKVV